MTDNLAAARSRPAAGRAELLDGGGGAAAATIALMSMSPSLGSLVRAALATWLPRAEVVSMTPAELVARGWPEWVIVAPEVGGAAALAKLRRLRTMGYDGPVLLLSGPGMIADAEAQEELTRLGGSCCALGDGFAERLAALAALATRRSASSSDDGRGGDDERGDDKRDDEPGGDEPGADWPGDGASGMAGDGGPLAGVRRPGIMDALHAEVVETRRLLAFAEVARRLPHALNNPLAALLAEAQLLELEELTPDQRESMERIVQLSRRVIGLVREFQLAQPRR